MNVWFERHKLCILVYLYTSEHQKVKKKMNTYTFIQVQYSTVHLYLLTELVMRAHVLLICV